MEFVPHPATPGGSVRSGGQRVPEQDLTGAACPMEEIANRGETERKWEWRLVTCCGFSELERGRRSPPAIWAALPLRVGGGRKQSIGRRGGEEKSRGELIRTRLRGRKETLSHGSTRDRAVTIGMGRSRRKLEWAEAMRYGPPLRF
jgi:hypothetical protein